MTEIRLYKSHELGMELPRWEYYVTRSGQVALSQHPVWLSVLEKGLGHTPYCLEAVEAARTTGLLMLAHVRSLLFGKFLVSLPYLNYGGVRADTESAARQLIDRAVSLADALDVRYLELRHERAIEHPCLTVGANAKVHMRLELPATADALWERLSAKVRNQVRKGQKCGLSVHWGRRDLLPEFYTVFSHNMRDLGTPVYGRRLFGAVLQHLPGHAELCIVRSDGRAVAAGLVLHGWGTSEVTSASSLRQYNHTNANMLMYWNLLARAAQRGQRFFDFGRCTPGSNTYRFKKQWGAVPSVAQWQHYVRTGSVAEMRPDNPKYQRRIRIWQRLPVGLTRLLGPPIVRGIP